MTRKRRETFTIEDHLCRECGGRILQIASGGTPSGGGNPYFRCADCGKGTCATGPSALCWCGFQFRGQTDRAYRCLPFEGNEHLREEFAKCGCSMDGKAEVGVIRITQ